MSRVTIGKLGGISTTLGQVTIPSGHTLNVQGDIFHHNNTGAIKLPAGTDAQRPGSPATGVIRFNTESNLAEVYTGSSWETVVGTGGGGSSSTLGTAANPATHGLQLKNAGLPSGLYFIQPSGQSAYRMYVDNDRNGGGWVLMAHVRTSTCQDHMTNGSVRISGTTGPRFGNTSTTKMADSWINAVRSASTYSGSTRWWLEAHGFGNPVKNMFVSSGATADLIGSASNQNDRTRVSTSYEGGLSDRGPNTGTRGLGDHHTSGGTYFAWGRHPESGNNCGFREDSLGASNGYLWMK